MLDQTPGKLVHILLVDGNETILNSLSHMLNGMGRKIHKAKNGDEAIKIATRESLALILLSIDLPGMDGFEVAEILQKEEDTKNISVILITDHQKDISFLLKGYRTGAVDYLTKPLDPEITKAKVQVIEKIYLQQQELRDKNTELEKLGMLVNQSADVMGVIQTRNYQFEAVNPVTSKVLGYPEKEIIGTSILNFIAAEDRVDSLQILNEGQRSNKEVIRFKNRLRKKDGSLVWLSWHMVLKGDKWYFNARDISDKKEAESEIKHNHKDLSDLKFAIDQSALVSIFDNRQQITQINEQFCKVSGYDKEELLGQPFHTLISSDDSENKLKEIWDNVKTGKVWKGEIRSLAKDESYYWVDTTVIPLTDERGKPIQFLSIAFDITPRKHIENNLKDSKDAAEIAVKAKAEFLATMSHEIRTPMNAVIAMTGLLMETDLNKEQIEYAETIKLGGENLLSVISDILDFSKIDSGKLELEAQSFDLPGSIEDVFGMLATSAHSKELELIYDIDDNIPLRILGDPIRLNQVLVNLVGNAIKFTDRGEIFVSVQQKHRRAQFVEVQFSIKDTGIGIPKEKIDHLFESFSQVDSSTTRKFGGTGLGLAISKKLVNLMGGDIWIESAIGVGSTFYFTLLVQEDPTRKITIPQITKSDKSKFTALIVDDNQTTVNFLKNKCEHWGIRFKTASSSADAISQMRMEKYDLIILDAHIQGVEALALSDKLVTMSGQESLPVIMLTPFGASRKLYDDTENIFVVSKPIRQVQLYNAICKSFGKNEMNYLSKEKSISEEPSAYDANKEIKILVAEDNIINQKVVQKILAKIGYTAKFVSNGKEAVAALRQEDYDLIFMDLQMPEMDGLEATRRINSNYENNPKKPIIIAMTANAMKGDKERCLEAGMQDYISKPVQVEDVESAIAKWFPADEARKSA